MTLSTEVSNEIRYPDLADLERPALESALEARGHERFHARQIFRWIYKRGVTDIDAMTDLSRELRATLAREFALTTPPLVAARTIDRRHAEVSAAPCRRPADRIGLHPRHAGHDVLRLDAGRLRDGLRVLPDRQDGARPQPDRRRNRRPGPRAGRALDLRDKTFNIVLMGMGEPLHNYDDTMKALRMLADEHGLGLSPRRVTLSTVGLLPALERLAREPMMPNLAVSLHAPTDEQRGELVPTTRKYGVADIIDACKRFPLERAAGSRSSTYCSPASTTRREDARQLAKLLAGVKSKVNLIPLNAARGHTVRTAVGRGDRSVRADSRRRTA